MKRIVAALLGAAFAFTVAADEPRLSIIIDDLGDRLVEGRAVVDLPGEITCAFLPHTPYAARLAEQAHRQGKEVMVHVPMESVEGLRLGPGGLTLGMSQGELGRTLRANLAAVPHAAGINNHMGSLLTRHPGHMSWLMAELVAAGRLYFVDSRTAEASVALEVAGEYGLPASTRDVFLDNERDAAAIGRQFAQALAIARQHGSAIAIGHPYPETIVALQNLLPAVKVMGIRLVPVSETVRYREQRRLEVWQASLSPSPTAAKNLKP